jgi:hypothetical protein
MDQSPIWFARWRAMLDMDAVEYEGMGVEVYLANDLPRQQIGYASDGNGHSLVGTDPGDWRPEWIVIGCDTGGGDPVFASNEQPHPVFWAVHGQGRWEPKLVAQSLEAFALCLKEFQRFTAGRSTPDEVAANPPSIEQQAQFLAAIGKITNGDAAAREFWALQIYIDLDSFKDPA